MKLLLNYDGVNQIVPMHGKIVYSELRKFAQDHFKLKEVTWKMIYLDDDFDQITLSTDLDLKYLFEASTKKHLKIYIRTEGQLKNERETPFFSEQKKVFYKNQIEQDQEKLLDGLEDQLEKINQGEQKSWEEKMEEKMNRLMDDRISGEIDVSQKSSKKFEVIHLVKCSSCDIYPIKGIRYNCLACALNLCPQCEQTVSHQHNMMKMKNVINSSSPMTHLPLLPCNYIGSTMNYGGPPPIPLNYKYLNHQQNKVSYPSHFPPSSGFTYSRPIFPQISQEKPKFFAERQISSSLDKEQINYDKDIKVTNKCFRLAKYFEGSNPEDYTQFLEENWKLPFGQLVKKYLEKNPDMKPNLEEMAKNNQKLQKLAFHFKEPAENFQKLILSNPCITFKELLTNVKKQREIKASEIEFSVLSENIEESIIYQNSKIKKDDLNLKREQNMEAQQEMKHAPKFSFVLQSEIKIVQQPFFQEDEENENDDEKLKIFIETIESIFGELGSKSEYRKFYRENKDFFLTTEELVSLYTDKKLDNQQ